ncbi:MAG: hypothetical protein IKT46_01100 [Clostridia bacterium]|nr:hypothetical protein [Clostridia bacterium]
MRKKIKRDSYAKKRISLVLYEYTEESCAVLLLPSCTDDASRVATELLPYIEGILT